MANLIGQAVDIHILRKVDFRADSEGHGNQHKGFDTWG